MISLREKLALGTIEVAIINEEQFVIKRQDFNIIEIVASIPKLIDNLRIRLSSSSLDVCSIDGHQKVVKRDGHNLIEILSDIVPIARSMMTSNASTSTDVPSVSIETNAAVHKVISEKFKPPKNSSAEPSALKLAVSSSAANQLRRYFIFA